MEGTQVGVLIEANKVGLGRLLEGKHRGSLEAKAFLEVMGDLAAKAMEGQLADEEISGLLVAADLAEGNGSRAVAVGLLDATARGLTCERAWLPEFCGGPSLWWTRGRFAWSEP